MLSPGYECPTKAGGNCMMKEKVGRVEKFFAAFFGTIPAVLVVLINSRFLSSVLQNIADNYVVRFIFVGLLVVLWFGTVYVVGRHEYPTLRGYIAGSAAFLSSTMGLTAASAPTLIKAIIKTVQELP